MGAVVGIDLGTTNTVVAAARGELPAAIPDESGSTLIPSIVSFLPSGAVLVGSAARERRSVDPRNTVYSIKRLIGRTWGTAEVDEAVARFPFELREGPGRATFVVARGETYTLPEISAFVLRKVKSIAELELGEPVDRAVITVPANFNDLQRAATKVAGRVAGLEILRVLNEPTAAALAFGHATGNRECIAVYDFGGGTFDFTLLRLTDDVFEVLATAGDTYLGGDDIDAAIVQRMSRHLRRNSRLDAKADAETFERLRGAAEQLKIDLSSASDARIRLSDYELAESVGGEFSLTRAELDELARPIIERTFTVCRDALASASLTPKEITHLLLVGGTTRDPFVRYRVQEFFGKSPSSDVDPHEGVALGAARQAMALTQLRATASGIPLPPSVNLPLSPHAFDTSVGPSEKARSVSAPTTQRFGSHYRSSIGSDPGTAAPENLPAPRERPAIVERPELKQPIEAKAPRSGITGDPVRIATEVSVADPNHPDTPALAPSNASRDLTARTRGAARAPRDEAGPLASAIVRPDTVTPRGGGLASAEVPRTDTREHARAVEGATFQVPALPEVRHGDSMPRKGDPSKDLPAVKLTATTAQMPRAFSRSMEVPDDLWDSPMDDQADGGPAAEVSVNAQESSRQESNLGWLGLSNADSAPDLPIVAQPKTRQLGADSTRSTQTPGRAAPFRTAESFSEEEQASSTLDAISAGGTIPQSDAELSENEPTVVRRSTHEGPTPQRIRGWIEQKLDATDLPIVGGTEKAEAANRLSEAEIRARYGNLPLIVGGKRMGTRESASKAYTPPLGTRTQTTVSAASDLRPAVPVPEMDLPIPSAATEANRSERMSEPALNPSIPSQRAGGGNVPRTKLDPVQTRPGSIEEQGNPRHPAPPLTEKSTPIGRPPPNPATFDDSFELLTTEPTRPRFSVDVALASAITREESPKSHRPSSRPSARQNIDELELPVPDLPLRQSAPEFGNVIQDLASPPLPLGPQKAKATESMMSRQPETAALYSSMSGGTEEGSQARHASSPARATIPFGQPPVNPFAPNLPNGPLGAQQKQVAASTLDLELPPLIAPVPRTYSTSGRPVLLIDVTPLSLCVETVGGYVDVVVNRNTPVPCERTREYVTGQDHQQTVNIRVAQGESRLFQENALLGEVQLSGIPAGVRGQARIAVTFGIDADGLLHVRAMDVTSGKAAVAELRLAGISGAHEPALPPPRQASKGPA